jgi:hypothetical protein
MFDDTTGYGIDVFSEKHWNQSSRQWKISNVVDDSADLHIENRDF